jgi:hypothetical protein
MALLLLLCIDHRINPAQLLGRACSEMWDNKLFVKDGRY